MHIARSRRSPACVTTSASQARSKCRSSSFRLKPALDRDVPNSVSSSRLISDFIRLFYDCSTIPCTSRGSCMSHSTPYRVISSHLLQGVSYYDSSSAEAPLSQDPMHFASVGRDVCLVDQMMRCRISHLAFNQSINQSKFIQRQLSESSRLLRVEKVVCSDVALAEFVVRPHMVSIFSQTTLICGFSVRPPRSPGLLGRRSNHPDKPRRVITFHFAVSK